MRPKISRKNISDERYMDEALRLARRALGNTFPNPMVGAIVVKKGVVVGRGFHAKAGLAHAEIEALRRAGKRARGATLYVNLEPCSHFGRTPPCSDAIIRAGVRRVVCSHKDPNPKVCGRGIALLRAAGITVTLGPREKEARLVNEQFIVFHTKKRPFVALKFAASLDGKLATRTRHSKWLTNDSARSYARRLRGNYCAVLVGVTTVLCDDPHLGARRRGARDPLRIILDPRLRTPLFARALRDRNVLLIASPRAPQARRRRLEKLGIPILTLRGERFNIRALLNALYKREITSVFVEGGGETLGRFIDARLVDRVYALYAPLLLGGADAVTIGGAGVGRVEEALRCTRISNARIGDAMFFSGDIA